MILQHRNVGVGNALDYPCWFIIRVFRYHRTASRVVLLQHTYNAPFPSGTAAASLYLSMETSLTFALQNLCLTETDRVTVIRIGLSRIQCVDLKFELSKRPLTKRLIPIQVHKVLALRFCPNPRRDNKKKTNFIF